MSTVSHRADEAARLAFGVNIRTEKSVDPANEELGEIVQAAQKLRRRPGRAKLWVQGTWPARRDGQNGHGNLEQMGRHPAQG